MWLAASRTTTVRAEGGFVPVLFCLKSSRSSLIVGEGNLYRELRVCEKMRRKQKKRYGLGEVTGVRKEV